MVALRKNIRHHSFQNNNTINFENTSPQDLIHPQEIRVRYLTFNDSGMDDRRLWLDKIFYNYSEFIYSENSTNFISTATTDFDALIIGGNDVGRIVKVLKTYAANLGNKLKICLLTNTSPAKRARAISAGFDDALDIERTAPTEAAWRARAMWRRYLQSFEQKMHEDRRYARLNEVADTTTMSNKQKAILMCIIDKKGRPISYDEIGNLIDPTHSSASTNHVQVRVCLLRKKLNPPYKLISIKGYGYQLIQNSLHDEIFIHHRRQLY